jgi:hypothetical protein
MRYKNFIALTWIAFALGFLSILGIVVVYQDLSRDSRELSFINFIRYSNNFFVVWGMTFIAGIIVAFIGKFGIKYHQKIQDLLAERNTLENKLVELSSKAEILNNSLSSNLITSEKWNDEMSTLRIQEERSRLNKIDSSIKVLISLESKLYSLDTLHKKGIISLEEKNAKIDELIAGKS